MVGAKAVLGALGLGRPELDAADHEGVTANIGSRYPDAAIIVPSRSTAVPSQAAETAPTQRDRHLRAIAEDGRMAWQVTSGYTGVPGPRRPCRVWSG